MTSSVDDIRAMIERAPEGTTHVIVATDTFDYEDYPVYVSGAEDVRIKVANVLAAGMQKVMEVYDLSGNLENQLIGGTRVGQDIIAEARHLLREGLKI